MNITFSRKPLKNIPYTSHLLNLCLSDKLLFVFKQIDLLLEDSFLST